MISAPSTITELSQRRLVRVFVSSTFRDMHEEREVLIKRIFPELRKLCERRGVSWTEVDLRWGITEVQAERGDALPICMAEIERCRPYFIGLLGDRYGWVPESIPDELIDQHPWLHDKQCRSITELEFRLGAINEPALAPRAFFYFRDPAYVDSLPLHRQQAFRELPSQEEITRYGEREASDRCRQRCDLLEALKDGVRQIGLPVRENYSNPEALGQLVLADFTAALDQDFPPETARDALDTVAAEHETFARSRTAVYIGRQEYFSSLETTCLGDGPPLILIGESGSGKSALLANWAYRHRAEHPDDFVLMHFVGANADSADWVAMLRRMLGELRRRFDAEQEIPTAREDLPAAFANALHQAAARLATNSGRIVLVLDGLNQLEDRQGALDLAWLPPTLPARIRLVCSTVAGRTLDAAKRLGWLTLTIQPLTVDERRQLITHYLRQYTKELAPEIAHLVAIAPAAGNPLYLRAVLEELRVFGIHEQLAERTKYYLGAKTISELFQLILQRYEEDYDNGAGLVRAAMSLIWAARRGLSEAELLDLMGGDGQPLPHACWSPLSLAAEASLIVRSGLIGFFHDYLRQAVRERYLPTPQQQQQAHLRLADYFEAQESGPRRTQELPWQLMTASAWQQLHDFLMAPSNFAEVWESDSFDAKAYWAQLESLSTFRAVAAYRPFLEGAAALTGALENIADLLTNLGYFGEADTLYHRLLRDPETSEIGARSAALLGKRGQLARAAGNLEDATQSFRRQEEVYRELRDPSGQAVARLNQARMLSDRLRMKEALGLINEAEDIFRASGNKPRLAECLLMKGIAINRAVGAFDQSIGSARYTPLHALQILHDAESLYRELGDQEGLGECLSEQGMIYSRTNNTSALELTSRAAETFGMIGNKFKMARSLDNRAVLLNNLDRLEEALKCNATAERIYEELDALLPLSECLGRQADILQRQARFDEALRKYNQRTVVARRTARPSIIAWACAKEGRLALMLGRESEGKTLIDEAIKLANLHCFTDVRIILEGTAQMLWLRRLRFEGAPGLERLAADVGDAIQFREMGAPREAMQKWNELREHFNALGDTANKLECGINIARIMGFDLQQKSEAVAILEDLAQLAFSYGHASLAMMICDIVADVQVWGEAAAEKPVLAASNDSERQIEPAAPHDPLKAISLGDLSGVGGDAGQISINGAVPQASLAKRSSFRRAATWFVFASFVAVFIGLVLTNQIHVIEIMQQIARMFATF